MKKRYLLVDYFNLFIRMFMIVPTTNENGEHFGGTFGFLRGLKSAVSLLNPTDVIVICDGPNSGLRRRLVSKDYKAHRKTEWVRGKIGSYDFLNEQEQKDSFNYQINRVNEYLETLPVKTMSIPYVEADDIIAEIVNTCNDECIIYSTDGDFKQLINERVSCYNPIAKILLTEKSFIEKNGFKAENHIFFKMIIGDKSDGIPGVNGIGPKTFLKLFPIVREEIFEGPDDLIQYSDFIVGSSSKEHTKSIKSKHKMILDNEELLRKNWDLMQLQEANISIQSKDLIRALLEKQPNKFNKIKLRMMFLQDKLQSNVKSFDEWSGTFSRLMR